jgi:hypothetical protein
MKIEVVSSSIGIGNIIAGILSWSANHSILWMICHIFCGWFYVFYFWIFK